MKPSPQAAEDDAAATAGTVVKDYNGTCIQIVICASDWQIVVMESNLMNPAMVGVLEHLHDPSLSMDNADVSSLSLTGSLGRNLLLQLALISINAFALPMPHLKNDNKVVSTKKGEGEKTDSYGMSFDG